MARRASTPQAAPRRSAAFEPISDFIDVGDRVAVRYVWRAEGRGPESNFESTHVFTLRKGKIVGVDAIWDHAEALGTLGLSE